MKSFLFLLICLPVFCFSQNETWSRAKVYTNETGVETLSGLGIEVDHGEVKPGFWLINDFSSSEIALMRSKGFTLEIIIPDVQKHYLNNNLKVAPEPLSIGCTAPPTYPTPTNFALGSMGGFFTYQEILN